MTTQRATICNKKGLHARAAAKLVKTAVSYKADVTVRRIARDGSVASSAGASSILSLLMLAAEIGSEVEVEGAGAESPQAVEAIIALIKRRFDEEE